MDKPTRVPSCQLCKLVFATESELFEHNLSLPHVLKASKETQDSESRSTQSDSASHHKQPSSTASKNGEQRQSHFPPAGLVSFSHHGPRHPRKMFGPPPPPPKGILPPSSRKSILSPPPPHHLPRHPPLIWLPYGPPQPGSFPEPSPYRPRGPVSIQQSSITPSERVTVSKSSGSGVDIGDAPLTANFASNEVLNDFNLYLSRSRRLLKKGDIGSIVNSSYSARANFDHLTTTFKGKGDSRKYNSVNCKPKTDPSNTKSTSATTEIPQPSIGLKHALTDSPRSKATGPSKSTAWERPRAGRASVTSSSQAATSNATVTKKPARNPQGTLRNSLAKPSKFAWSNGEASSKKQNSYATKSKAPVISHQEFHDNQAPPTGGEVPSSSQPTATKPPAKPSFQGKGKLAKLSDNKIPAKKVVFASQTKSRNEPIAAFVPPLLPPKQRSANPQNVSKNTVKSYGSVRQSLNRKNSLYESFSSDDSFTLNGNNSSYHSKELPLEKSTHFDPPCSLASEVCAHNGGASSSRTASLPSCRTVTPNTASLQLGSEVCVQSTAETAVLTNSTKPGKACTPSNAQNTSNALSPVRVSPVVNGQPGSSLQTCMLDVSSELAISLKEQICNSSFGSHLNEPSVTTSPMPMLDAGPRTSQSGTVDCMLPVSIALSAIASSTQATQCSGMKESQGPQQTPASVKPLNASRQSNNKFKEFESKRAKPTPIIPKKHKPNVHSDPVQTATAQRAVTTTAAGGASTQVHVYPSRVGSIATTLQRIAHSDALSQIQSLQRTSPKRRHSSEPLSEAKKPKPSPKRKATVPKRITKSSPTLRGQVCDNEAAPASQLQAEAFRQPDVPSRTCSSDTTVHSIVSDGAVRVPLDQHNKGNSISGPTPGSTPDRKAGPTTPPRGKGVKRSLSKGEGLSSALPPAKKLKSRAPPDDVSQSPTLPPDFATLNDRETKLQQELIAAQQELSTLLADISTASQQSQKLQVEADRFRTDRDKLSVELQCVQSQKAELIQAVQLLTVSEQQLCAKLSKCEGLHSTAQEQAQSQAQAVGLLTKKEGTLKENIEQVKGHYQNVLSQKQKLLLGHTPPTSDPAPLCEARDADSQHYSFISSPRVSSTYHQPPDPAPKASNEKAASPPDPLSEASHDSLEPSSGEVAGAPTSYTIIAEKKDRDSTIAETISSQEETMPFATFFSTATVFDRPTKNVNTVVDSPSSKCVEAPPLITEPESEAKQRVSVSTEQAAPEGSAARVVEFEHCPSDSPAILSIKVVGQKLFSAATDGGIRVYSTRSGALLDTLCYHRKSVTCLEIYVTEDTSLLISASIDKDLHLYDLKRNERAATFHLGVRVRYLSVQSSQLFVGLTSGSVVVIDLQAMKSMGKRNCHTKDISCLTVCESTLCTASFDETVMCWDVTGCFAFNSSSKAPLKLLKKLDFSSTVLCMQIVERRLYTACGDATIQVFDIEGWARLNCVSHGGPVSSLAVVGRVLISTCFDRLVRCFDLERMELLQVYAGIPNKIFSLCVENDIIYTGTNKGEIKATKLDLTVFYTCEWENCDIPFGNLHHLKHHVKGHVPSHDFKAPLQQCRWKDCQQRVACLMEHLQEHAESTNKQ